MEEARGSRKRKNRLTESDVAASRKLMQLSNEDNSDNIDDERDHRLRSDDEEEEEEVDQSQSLRQMTSAIIQQIFGNDEVFRPKKQRRYRSLLHIYMTTTPIVKSPTQRKLLA